MSSGEQKKGNIAKQESRRMRIRQLLDQPDVATVAAARLVQQGTSMAIEKEEIACRSALVKERRSQQSAGVASKGATKRAGYQAQLLAKLARPYEIQGQLEMAASLDPSNISTIVSPSLYANEGGRDSAATAKTSNIADSKPGAVAVPGPNVTNDRFDLEKSSSSLRAPKSDLFQYVTAYRVGDDDSPPREIPLAVAADPTQADEEMANQVIQAAQKQRKKMIQCMLAVFLLLLGVVGAVVGTLFANRSPTLVTNSPSILLTDQPSDTPTTSPSSVPTSVATSGFEVTIRVEVTFDTFPHEFGMTLFHQRRGAIEANFPVGSFVNQTFVSRSFRLDPDTYDLRVTDSAKDGLCCVHGTGFIEIYAELEDGDELLARHNGEYQGSADIAFFVPATMKEPTASPTFATPYPTTMDAIGDGDFEIQLVIVFDEFPAEVSLTLQDEDGIELYSIEPGFFTSQGTFSQLFSLDTGAYSLVVGDTFGDGICCSSGEGGVTILNATDARTLAFSDGNYGTGTSIRFVVGDITLSPTLAPTESPSQTPSPSFFPATPYPTNEIIGDGEVLIRIELTLDNFAGETSMMLLDRETNMVLQDYPVGFFTAPGLFVQSFRLNPGSFVLSLADSSSDGICCAHGQGFIEVYAELEEGDRLVASHDGQYQGRVDIEFVVDGPNEINQPTASPMAATPYPTTMDTIGEGGFEIQLAVTLDQFPRDVSLSLQNEEGVELYVAEPGFFNSQGTFRQLFGLAAGVYSLVVGDAFGDGICCSNGVGGISVLNATDWRTMAFSDGVYGAGTTIWFAVGDVTLSPTAAPSFELFPSLISVSPVEVATVVPSFVNPTSNTT